MLYSLRMFLLGLHFLLVGAIGLIIGLCRPFNPDNSRLFARRTVAIGKKSLGWIPLFGQLFWLGGNVLVDRKNAYQARKAMQLTTRILRDDTSIWIFPEGTRNPSEQLLAFKKGAFHMAVEAGVPIVPVCVSRYTRRLGLNRWRRRTVVVRSLAPIATAGLGQQDLPALIEQCRTQMQQCIDRMDSELNEA